jgi:predicted nucleic acid-binding protein
MTRAFLDTNIAIYAFGRDHPLREPSREVLNLAGDNRDQFFTSAEVLQELLHKFRALRIWDSARATFDDFAALMRDRIEPLLAEDVTRAAAFADEYPRLSARDLVHLAVMLRAAARYIITADGAFDEVREIERLDPRRIEEWRERVTTG